MWRHFDEPVSGFTHLFGALLALAGLAWLLMLTQGDYAQMIPVAIFGVSMVIVYLSSTTLHLVKCSVRKKLWLNRVDHAAIYTLIAGTYTPILYNSLSGAWRWQVLGSLWGLALVGMAYKLFLLYEDTIWTQTFYVVTGAFGFMLAGSDLLKNLPLHVLALVLGGGLIYLIGAVIFGLRKPNLHPNFGFHELWHIFVMAGSALHFTAMLFLIG
jgi:hemolysin III